MVESGLFYSKIVKIDESTGNLKLEFDVTWALFQVY